MSRSMQRGGRAYSVDDLWRALQQTKENEFGVVAVLWTWLQSHLLTLGSLEEKPSAIQRRAAQEPPFESIENVTLEWLRESPLINAAELLARIAISLRSPARLGASANLIEKTLGIGGEEVLVAVREPALAVAMHDASNPPTAVEHPSLSALAPRLMVCPISVNGIELTIKEGDGPAPADREWEVVLARFQTAWSERGPDALEVHLDTLGEAGLSGWKAEPERQVGRYDPETIADEDQTDAVAAARKAVTKARSPLSLLVLPELAATPAVLEAIADELASAPEPGAGAAKRDQPALTVVGAYHREPALGGDFDPGIYGSAPLAKYVNEAVVMGPNGGELWCQRKMSSAEGGATDSDPGFVEDIQLGQTLVLAPTPLGTIVVTICLDAFAPHVRERLLHSPAEFLIVPSLSPTIRRHRESLQHLVQVLWAVAFVCNRSPFRLGDPLNKKGVSAWNDDFNRSFWVNQGQILDPPAAREATDHPSFVFTLELTEPRDRRRKGLEGAPNNP